MTNILSKVKMKCINSGNGCSSIIFCRDAEKHHENCDFTYVNCTTCNFRDLLQNFQLHLNSGNGQCPEKNQIRHFCTFCNDEINIEGSNTHYANCKLRTESCYYCNDIYKYKISKTI